MFKIDLICRRRAVGYQLVMPSVATVGSVGCRRWPTDGADHGPTMGHRQCAIWVRMATPDYSGWLLRATPDGYAGHRGSQCHPQGPTWPWGKHLPDFPVPVPSTSTIAGLGRDSRIYHGGGSSLCWSVACVLRPHNLN